MLEIFSRKVHFSGALFWRQSAGAWDYNKMQSWYCHTASGTWVIITPTSAKQIPIK